MIYNDALPDLYCSCDAIMCIRFSLKVPLRNQ